MVLSPLCLGTGSSEGVIELQSKTMTELSCGDLVMVSLLPATDSRVARSVQGTVPR